MELMGCQNLAVPADVMHHVVRVESSFNPYAIGVVGGRLARQPANLPEALATVRMLESRGFNFSLGLAQVNRYNLAKYGIGSYEQAFQACPNLQAGSRILAECHGRAGRDWGKSFSCYYSGNFTTGFRQGYVQKIYASMRASASSSPGAIQAYSNASRRVMPVAQYPLHGGDAVAPVRAVDTLPARISATASSAASTTVMPTRAPMLASVELSRDATDLVILQPNGAEPKIANVPAAEALTPRASGTAAIVTPSDAAFVF